MLILQCSLMYISSQIGLHKIIQLLHIYLYTTYLGATPLSDVNNAVGGGDDYYQSMVVAAIIAAVATLAFLVVTGIYLKRTTTYKAIISGDQGGKRRKATFTNRAFKVTTLKLSRNSRKLIFGSAGFTTSVSLFKTLDQG